MGAPHELIDANYRLLSHQGRDVLFHVPTTSLFEISQDMAHVLKGTSTSHDDSIQEELKSLGLWGSSPACEEIKIENFPAKALILNVTAGCNLSCSYCYKADLSSLSNGGVMSFETAREAIDLFYQHSPQRKDYTITFFGGEPLSAMGLIRQVTDYANTFFASRGAKVGYALTTNGTLLTPSLIQELYDRKIDLTISIDGPEAIHNKTRLFEGGKGSYKAASQHLATLHRIYQHRTVPARVTLTRGVTDVAMIWDHLYHTLGFREIGFAPATASDNAFFNVTDDELGMIFEGFKQLGRHYVDEACQNRYNGFSNLHRLVHDIHEGRKKKLPCGAGVGLLSVSHAGSIDLCHRFTGSSYPSFGSVQQGLDTQAFGRFLEKRANHREGDCATCHIRHLCAGGCYHESFVKYNDPTQAVLHYCDTMRDWVDFALNAYLDIATSNPQFFETYFPQGGSHETF